MLREFAIERWVNAEQIGIGWENSGGIGEDERQEHARWIEFHKGRRGNRLILGCPMNSES